MLNHIANCDRLEICTHQTLKLIAQHECLIIIASVEGGNVFIYVVLFVCMWARLLRKLHHNFHETASIKLV